MKSLKIALLFISFVLLLSCEKEDRVEQLELTPPIDTTDTNIISVAPVLFEDIIHTEVLKNVFIENRNIYTLGKISAIWYGIDYRQYNDNFHNERTISYDGLGLGEPSDMIKSTDNHVYFSARSGLTATDSSSVLIKTGIDGIIEWKRFLPFHFDKINLTSLSEIVGVGTGSTGPGNNIQINKLSNDGQVLWEKILDYGHFDKAWDFKISDEDEIVILSTNYTGRPNEAIYRVTKLDSEGNILWENDLLERIAVHTRKMLVQSQNGGYFVSSTSRATQLPTFLTKISEEGEIIWDKTSDTMNTTALLEQPNGHLLTCGHIAQESNGYKNLFIAELDANGDLIWIKEYSYNYDLLEIQFINEMDANEFIFSGIGSTLDPLGGIYPTV